MKKFKEFWNDHKGTMCIIGGVAAGVAAVCYANSNNSKTNDNKQDEINKKNDKAGRDCLMTVTVTETGEEIGTLPICEGLYNDWKDLIPIFMKDDYGK